MLVVAFQATLWGGLWAAYAFWVVTVNRRGGADPSAFGREA
jgi:hypothetical protein